MCKIAKGIIGLISSGFASLVLVLLIAATGVQTAQAETPRGIAEFRLGEDISTYQNQIIEGSDMAIRHSEFIREVQVIPPEGFKTCYIAYGICAKPGRIVEIKIKYVYDDERFFQRLVKLFKRRYGEPAIYKGDPFGALKVWKWVFKEENGDRITLWLQYYPEHDGEHTFGNSLKLKLTTALDEERKCQEAKTAERAPAAGGRKPDHYPVKDSEFEIFMPR